MDQLNVEEHKYGRCVECKQINTGRVWCQTCNSKRFQQNFDKWTSGNDDIDKFIQNNQLSAKNRFQLLEWIPYDRFSKVTYVAEGGFSKVYKAKWNGFISFWDESKNQWKRSGLYSRRSRGGNYVALKHLNNSQNLTLDVINEIMSYVKLNERTRKFLGTFGVSQDPITKDYIVVLPYAGKIKNYLKRKTRIYGMSQHEIFYLILRRKIIALLDIVTALKKIHEEGLLHRNLHIGNIMTFKYTACITDIGFCKPANYKELSNAENSVYGVLPYVAPEILRRQPYTKESDIYSFGIIMYEIISGIPPYHDIEHNEYLALKICEGLRPRFNTNIPQLILHLIKKCLDANPLNRPNIKDLTKIFLEWLEEFKRYNKGESGSTEIELIKQIGESEKVNNSTSSSNSSPSTNKIHPGAIYTSRLLNFNNLPEPKNSDDYYEIYDNISSIEYPAFEQ
ncbi:hypothetical protein RclHR1_01490018 [Rhizophagus clarus]|uniref:Protein kinase domain-containing protein n=1 Tax=Rhizophagus clarus TaxID=94130 RepID=A0A2Z6QDR5_9GLOM|nr:hypothetical protein RclHR1_01490018 [Rhizophagus clarus]